VFEWLRGLLGDLDGDWEDGLVIVWLCDWDGI
jgi:hypothetical protein